MPMRDNVANADESHRTIDHTRCDHNNHTRLCRIIITPPPSTERVAWTGRGR